VTEFLRSKAVGGGAFLAGSFGAAFVALTISLLSLAELPLPGRIAINLARSSAAFSTLDALSSFGVVLAAATIDGLGVVEVDG
jgi:hypothetical protein